MKSAQQLATAWDQKPPDRWEDLGDAIYFIANAGTSASPSREGIAHCFRALDYKEIPADPCAQIALKFLGQGAIGRPALRMATAGLIAFNPDVRVSTSYAAAHFIADFTETPACLGQLSHAAKFDCEVVVSQVLGPDTRRGLTAARQSLLTIISDTNDGRAIPTARKLRQIEYLRTMVPDPQLQIRAVEVGRELECRIARPSQAAGVFYSGSHAAAVELEEEYPSIKCPRPVQLDLHRGVVLAAIPVMVC